MRTVRYEVNQQELKAMDSTDDIYKGAENYLNLKFDFDNKNWQNCVKAIVFVKGDGKEIPYILKNNAIVVPQIIMNSSSDVILFYLVGKKNDYRIQTKKEYILLK